MLNIEHTFVKINQIQEYYFLVVLFHSFVFLIVVVLALCCIFIWDWDIKHSVLCSSMKNEDEVPVIVVFHKLFGIAALSLLCKCWFYYNNFKLLLSIFCLQWYAKGNETSIKPGVWYSLRQGMNPSLDSFCHHISASLDIDF